MNADASSIARTFAESSLVFSGAAIAVAQPSAQIIPFSSGRYAIPPEQMKEFSKLDDDEQERVLRLLSLFEMMEAGGVVATSNRLGKQLCNLRGYGAHNLRNAYYKWLRGGWQVLPRTYKNGSTKLPEDFIQHLRGCMEKNARSMRQAMNLIRREWMLGKEIPGFGTWQAWFAERNPVDDLPTVCPGYPAGWSDSNLYELQPVKAQRALKTRGFAGAKKFLPSIVRDPSGLLPLQLVVIDDFRIDQMCFYWDRATGRRAVLHMAGVAAMDVATRRIIGLILKPRLPDDAGKKESITRAEVRFLLYNVIRDYGVPNHGMTILCENAAAAVTTELELTFKNLFGGKIAIARTGVIDRAVIEAGFRDTGGKPWLKGWIESFFNLMHNVAAGILPGQIGATYDLSHPDHKEKLRLTERLIGLGPRDARLSDEQLAQAAITFQSNEALHDAYLKIFQYIEERTDHNLLGFAEVLEWRRSETDAWHPAETIGVLTQAEQAKVEVRARMQSPRERWAALHNKSQFSEANAAALMMLLLTPKKAKLKSGKITFEHGGMGYTFLTDPRGEIAQTVADGSDLLCYFDPTRPAYAHLCTLKGKLLGEVKRLGHVAITDLAAVSEAERQCAAHIEGHLAELRARPLHIEEAKANAAANATNEALIAEAAATRGEDADTLRNKKSLGATLTRTLKAEDLAQASPGAIAAHHVATAEERRRNEERTEKAHARAVQAVGNTLTAEDIAAMKGDTSPSISTPPPAEIGSAEDYK